MSQPSPFIERGVGGGERKERRREAADVPRQASISLANESHRWAWKLKPDHVADVHFLRGSYSARNGEMRGEGEAEEGEVVAAKREVRGCI